MPETTSSTVTAEPSRLSTRLPHWGWCLLLTGFLVVGYVGLAIWLPYHREGRIAERVKSWGGNVKTETESPEWLRQLMSFCRMTEFRVFDRLVAVQLKNSKVSDVEIAHLSGLTKLKVLDLTGTLVTDGGLVHLNGLTNLERLDLVHTAVTDACVPELSGMKNLRRVYLDGTWVTDKGIRELKAALPESEIYR